MPCSTALLVLHMQDLVFGRTFTDHLLIVEHQDGSGWGRPHIRPFAQANPHDLEKLSDPDKPLNYYEAINW